MDVGERNGDLNRGNIVSNYRSSFTCKGEGTRLDAYLCAAISIQKASRTVDFPALFGPTRTFIPFRRIVKSLSDLKFWNLTTVNIRYDH
jgi:hypothetical protein